MTVSGAAIRARILQRYKELGLRRAATADGTTTTLLDTLRMRGDTLGSGDYGDAWIRMVAGTNNNGFIGKLDLLTPASGTVTFSPAATGITKSADPYEIWKHGIFPDDADMARDRALQVRCSTWRLKALSVLTDCDTWAARGAETVASQTMDFPNELFEKSTLVTNSGANGGVKSESYYAQPTGAPGGVQSMRVWGDVSVRTGSGQFRVRDITNSADITVVGLPASGLFTKRGWQRFDCTLTIPAGCEEIQVWPSGVGANDNVEWTGIGILPQLATRFNLPSRVLSETELARIYAWRGPAGNHLRPDWMRLPAETHRSAARVEIVFGLPPASVGAVYYMEQHHYAALQPDYLTVAHRTTGDAATTDCQLDYIAAATVVELLEDMDRSDVLNRIYVAAEKDLGFWERKVGTPPMLVEENVPAGRGPRLMRL